MKEIFCICVYGEYVFCAENFLRSVNSIKLFKNFQNIHEVHEDKKYESD